MDEKDLNGPVFSEPKTQKKIAPEFKGEEWSELLRTGLFAVLIALCVRTLIFEPFNIPSGSMKPTLLVGDYLYVSKYSYGYSMYSLPFAPVPFKGRIDAKTPERGDVVVYKLPTNTRIDYIKRVVGLPGDTIQMIGGRLYINGERVPRKKIKDIQETDTIGAFFTTTTTTHLYEETLPNGVVHYIYEESDNGPLDNTPLYTVPDGHYFMMGDNRDNSKDSRVMNHVGFVPFDNLVGRAERIFFSINNEAKVWEVWRWPFAVRYDRLLDKINEFRPTIQP